MLLLFPGNLLALVLRRNRLAVICKSTWLKLLGQGKPADVWIVALIVELLTPIELLLLLLDHGSVLH